MNRNTTSFYLQFMKNPKQVKIVLAVIRKSLLILEEIHRLF